MQPLRLFIISLFTLLAAVTVQAEFKGDITPNTLWKEEVLLLRQSFKFPKFENGKRYRLIVGGAGHSWSGEGYALYMNGKRVSELTGGGYKNGGSARGVYLFEDLAREASGKEVTLAIKAFLRQNHHRNKAAPPSGHLSVWLEEAKLPAAVEAIPLEDDLSDSGPNPLN